MRRALLLLMLAAGCSRSFSAPTPPPTQTRTLTPNGLGCSDAGACQSGFCVDEVCCASLCDPGSSCRGPEGDGHCQTLPLGAACRTGSQCPSSFCADGVCCDVSCDGGCESCVRPGLVGQCGFVPDDTDPRAVCDAPCQACQRGSCGPSQLGLDPHGDCGVGNGCGIDGACHALDGGACSQDSDCVFTHCVVDRCLALEAAAIDDPLTMNRDAAVVRHLSSVAEMADGTVAALFEESELGDLGQILEHDTFAAMLLPSGQAQAVNLYTDRAVDHVVADATSRSAVTAMPDGFFVAAAPAAANYTTCAQLSTVPCNVFGFTLSPAGIAGPIELIGSPDDGLGQYFYGMHLVADPAGPGFYVSYSVDRVDAAGNDLGEQEVVRHRGADGTWSDAARFANDGGPYWELLSTASGVLLLGVTESDYTLQTLDGAVLLHAALGTALDLGADTLYYPLRSWSAPDSQRVALDASSFSFNETPDEFSTESLDIDLGAAGGPAQLGPSAMTPVGQITIQAPLLLGAERAELQVPTAFDGVLSVSADLAWPSGSLPVLGNIGSDQVLELVASRSSSGPAAFALDVGPTDDEGYVVPHDLYLVRLRR